MEQDDLLHLPAFSAPDFMQPALEKADLSVPGFVQPDPHGSPYGSWPLLSAEMDVPASEQADPALPGLLEPERPDMLTYPAENAPALAGPAYEPEKIAWQRPGEPDSAARALVLGSPDEASLPAQLAYAQLYTRDDGMTRRRRHFAMLEPGLAESAGDSNGR